MGAMTTSRYAAIVGTMALALATVCFAPLVAAAATADEAAIRALEDRFAAAVNAGDVNAIMKSYVPDQSLVVFDVVPPRQYLGADAYRKDWVDFFATSKVLRSLTSPISPSPLKAISASVTASSV